MYAELGELHAGAHCIQSFTVLSCLVQRHGVVIETCMVGNNDSAFLQQAAHITEGLYLRPQRTSALLQYLLVSICKLIRMLTRASGVCCLWL